MIQLNQHASNASNAHLKTSSDSWLNAQQSINYAKVQGRHYRIQLNIQS